MLQDIFHVDTLKISTKQEILVDIQFSISSSLALIGQSGSGKSLTLKAILDMLPSQLNKQFIYKSDFELNSSTIAYVPQNPFTSLSPLTKIKKQFFCSKEKQIKLLNIVNVNPVVLNKFPIQLSGGQLQRIIIAIALSSDPKLLLLDEPTTALDSKNKKIIIDILNKIKQKLNLKILFVTHDIKSVEDICEDIAILKNGKICEYGKLKDIITNPQNSYTKQLLSSSFQNREFRK